MTSLRSTWIVKYGPNVETVTSLKETYNLLQELQANGIRYAKVIGSYQDVRLTDNGFWIWTAAT